MKEILKLDHIQKYYGNGGNVTKAIQDISFSVQDGEFVGIMGASGSGKTTLLNCISTIDTVSAGHIYLDGTDVTEINEKQIARFRRENLGFVFQDFNLLDTLTISENIALALTINKVPAGEIDGRVREMAGKLNITDILDKYPYQVSGGQKQRCACARAIILMTNPCTAKPDELLCNGCSTCANVCPYGAITYEEKEVNDHGIREVRRLAQVNSALCQGCGACTVACPSGAMDLQGFSNRQIIAEVDAICR